MSSRALLLVLALLLVHCQVSLGARILVSTKPGGKSHYINMIEVVKALLSRSEGNRVMVMAPEGDEEFWRTRLPDGVKYTIEVPPVSEEELSALVKKLEVQGPLQQLFEHFRLLSTLAICPDRTMEEAGPAVRAFKPEVMLLDVTNPCAIMHARMLGLPAIGLLTTAPLQPFLHHSHGVYTNTALYPTWKTISSLDIYRPTLPGRMHSIVMHYMVGNVILAVTDLLLDRKYAKAGISTEGGGHAVNSRKVSPVLIASEPLMNLPVLLPPHVKAIGSITPHVSSKALPGELETFLNSAGRAGLPAVFMSFGTTGVGNLTVEVFSQVWAALPNVTVLWRVPGDVTDREFDAVRRLSNVRLEAWVDQNAVLAHPRVQLFVTHGGHNGVSEGAFHGVPLLCLPQFADQFDVCAAAEQRGYAVSVAVKQLQAEVPYIQETVSNMLGDPSYMLRAQAMSAGMNLFRRYRTPAETAAELIELEVEGIRQGAASVLLPPPTPLLWELEQVAAYLILGGMVAAICWLSLALVKVSCRCLCCRRSRGEAKKPTAAKEKPA